MDVDTDLEAQLLRAFSSLGTDDRESLISQFQKIINEGAVPSGMGSGRISEAECTFFLEMNNWNLQEALGAYCDFAGGETELPKMSLISESTQIFVPAAHQSAQTYHSSTTSSNDSIGGQPGQWVLLDPQSPLPPCAHFRKTFHLMNMGRDRWPAGCSLQFADGERMHVQERVPLLLEHGHAGCLYPGDSLHVSVELVAPSLPNTYLSRWRLRTATGMPFGDVICMIVSVREEQEEGMQALMQRLSRISTSDCDLLEAPLAEAPAPNASAAGTGSGSCNELALGLGSALANGGFFPLDAGASFAASAGNPFAAGIPWVGTPQSKPIPAQPPPTPNSQSPLTSPTCTPTRASLAQQLDALPACMNPNVCFPDAIVPPQPLTQDIFFGVGAASAGLAASTGGQFAADALPSAAAMVLPGTFMGVPASLVSPLEGHAPNVPPMPMQNQSPLAARVANALNPLAEQQSSAHRALSIERSDAFDALKQQQQQQQQTRITSEPTPEQSTNPDSTSDLSDMCL